MREYKVDILPVAIDDVAKIHADIVNRYNDRRSADQVASSIFDETHALKISPKRTQVQLIVSELELRFFKIGKYTAVYHVDDTENVVRVYGVFHSHRNIVKIIKNRF